MPYRGPGIGDIHAVYRGERIGPHRKSGDRILAVRVTGEGGIRTASEIDEPHMGIGIGSAVAPVHRALYRPAVDRHILDTEGQERRFSRCNERHTPRCHPVILGTDHFDVDITDGHVLE